jgi:CDP-diacylglycerol--glycerol-3-phosphate 3-phosphatidyltransferase
MLLNAPNLLSTSRILLVPLLVAVLLTKFDGKEFVGLGVFLLASFTDFLDGFLARRQKKVTRLGQLLDPAADKILNSAALIALVELGLAPAWMVVVIVGREFAVSALRSVAAAEHKVIAAIVSAKIKTTLQMIAISLLIFYNQLGSFERLAPVSLWLAMFASVYSGLEYFIRYGPELFGRNRRTGSGSFPRG